MKTVDDVDRVRKELLNIFPDAIRGSVAKSKWGKGRKQLHLSYWIGADTVGGLMVQAKGNLLYFIEWDTNQGHEYQFAESDTDIFIERIKSLFADQVHKIDLTVGEFLKRK